MAKTAPTPPANLEAETRRIGREMWERLERRRPTVFEPRWWLDHILEWAAGDDAVRLQMLRFVDALPALRTSESVSQHLQEFFEDIRLKIPDAARLGLDVAEPGSMLGKAIAFSARTNARRMADRFFAGDDVDEIRRNLFALRRKGLGSTLYRLPERALCEADADEYQQAYLDLIERLPPLAAEWPEHPLLDRDGEATFPRCRFTLTLSALDSQFRPVDARGTRERVASRLRPILRAAVEQGVHVDFATGKSSEKDLVLDIVREVLLEKDLRSYPHFGVVLQAYLRETAADLEALIDWAKKRGTPIGVCLVRGSLWDQEMVVARNNGWPERVFSTAAEGDLNFERLTQSLLEQHSVLRPAIGGQSLRSLAHACASATALAVPPSAWEIQMPYGVADEQALVVSEAGFRVRLDAPFGDRLSGMARFARRLLENASAASILRDSYDREARIDELLSPPETSTNAA